MAKTLTNGDLARLVTNILTDEFNPLINEVEPFQAFIMEITQVVAKYAGGDVVMCGHVADYNSVRFEHMYQVTVARDENCPEHTVWDSFDEGNPL